MLLYKLYVPFLADYSNNKRLLVIILKKNIKYNDF